MNKMARNRKGQGWALDFLVGLIIFSMAGIAFFLYSINYTNEVESNFQKMLGEGNSLTESLLSSGYPANWNSDNVVSIGISDNERINETKLDNFYELSLSDYEKTRRLFKINYDYFLFFSKDIVIDGVRINGIGKPETDLDNIDASNLVKITRYVIYNGEAINLYLYVWKEEVDE